MKKIIPYIAVGIASLAMFYISYFDEKKKVLEIAEKTFIEAVRQDLDNRVALFNGQIAYSQFSNKKEYKHMEIAADNRKEEHSLDSLDYERNMDDDIQIRILHTLTIALHKYAHPDTVNNIWQKRLQTQRINRNTCIEINSSERDTTMQIRHNEASLACKSYTILPTYYAGIRNEIKLQAYIHLSFIGILNYSYWLYIPLGIIGYCILLICISLFSSKVSKSTKTDTIIKKAETTPLSDLPNVLKGMYQLSDNVVYDPKSGFIHINDETIKLTNQTNLLLKHLVEAEGLRMHGVDLVKAIWGNDDGNIDKLYTLNSRLRSNLNKLGNGFSLQSCNNGYFQLTIPDLTKFERLKTRHVRC